MRLQRWRLRLRDDTQLPMRIGPMTVAISLALITALGCGGDDPPAGDASVDDGLAEIGFATPTEATTAYAETGTGWELQGAANWSCLNQSSTNVPTTTDIVLTGDLLDFQTDEPLIGGEFTLFGDDGISGTAIGNATSDNSGSFSINLPMGQTHWSFKVVMEEALDTYSINRYYEPDQAAQSQDIDSVSLLTAQALPAFIGVTRTPGLGIIAARISDCDNNRVMGAVAMVSETAGTPTPTDGAVSYYFSALSTSLPVRHSLESATNKDGVFVAIELPPGQTRYLQVWGFVDAADLADGEMTLLAELSTPIITDSVVTTRLRPLRQ